MAKKIYTGILAFLFGIFAVFVVIKIASAGYKFGQFLQLHTAEASPASCSSSA